MDDFPQSQLNQLVASEGVELLENGQRCEGLLKDTFPDHAPQVLLLMNALKQGVPKELLASQHRIPYAVTHSRLSQKLSKNLFMQDQAAEWAVEAWSIALGVRRQPDVVEAPNPIAPGSLEQDHSGYAATQLLQAGTNAGQTQMQTPSAQRDTAQVPLAEIQKMMAEQQSRAQASQTQEDQGQVAPQGAMQSATSSFAPTTSEARNRWVLPVATLVLLALFAGGGLWAWRLFTSNPGSTTALSTSADSNFSDIQNIPTATVNYGGSTTWAQVRKLVDPEIAKAFPNFRLRYVDPVGDKPGSSTGIKMLLEGQLSVAQSSRPLKDEEFGRAQTRNLRLEQIPVAIDAIVVVTHPDLNIPGLTVEQLKLIYTGKITNWQEVGGPDLKIIPISRDLKAGGTVDFFVEQVLGKKIPLGSMVQIARDTTSALRQTAATPGSLYYGSAPEVVDQCTVKPLPLAKITGQWIAPYREPFVPLSSCPGQRNVINHEVIRNGTYPLTRNLFVVILANGQLEEQAGRGYANLLLTEQGQKLLNQAGFVSLK
jgi:phosphate transport system substrate-binding protein